MKDSKKNPVSQPLVSETPPQDIQPQVIWKGQQTFRHDLFKLQMGTAKRNISWKKKEPELVSIEHVHFYHSHSNRGEFQKYCVPVANHFHEMTPSVMPDGTIVAKCGPPLKKVDRILSNGKVKTSVEPVQFFHEEKGVHLVDDHTHPVVYVASEILSQDHIKAIQQENAEGLKALGVRAPTSSPIPALKTDSGLSEAPTREGSSE